jgi:hypothetical protein
MAGDESQQGVIRALNSTLLSQHVALLMKNEKAIQDAPLILVSLLVWAAEHTYADYSLGEYEVGEAIRATEVDPQALYDNLADDRMMNSQSLEDAAEVLASRMSDLLDDRSLPAQSLGRSLPKLA